MGEGEERQGESGVGERRTEKDWENSQREWEMEGRVKREGEREMEVCKGDS